MNKKLLRTAMPMLSLFTLVALACTCGGFLEEPTPTPAPLPTLAPTSPSAPTLVPTKAGVPTTPPTRAPQPTQAGAKAPFTLSSKPFTHKSGAFSIQLPEGWKIEERNTGVFASSPDGVASIDISFVNTGTQLDSKEVSVYVDAFEQNFFATYNAYKLSDKKTLSDGCVFTVKSLNLKSGTAQTVGTYYCYRNTVLFQQDFWANSNVFSTYGVSFDQVSNSMKTDGAAAAKAPVYGETYTFTDPNKKFEFRVPYSWKYERTKGTSTNVDTFTSPDGASVFQNITYDDGKTVTQSESGKFALKLLKDVYKLNDVVITDDKVQKDGSERLSWYSTAQGVKGQSFFETRGTTFLMLSWIANTADYNIFSPVWDVLLNSYKIPK
jgi:hypothetical protein